MKFPARLAGSASLLGLVSQPMAAAGGLAGLPRTVPSADPQAAVQAALNTDAARKAEKQAGKGKKAGSSDDDDDDDEDDDDKKKKKKDEDGDDESDDEEMRAGAPVAVRCARKRERARIAAILNHEAAAANHGLAASLAFTTNMGRTAACAQLVAAGKSAKGGLNDRMAGHANRGVPLDTPAQTPEQASRSILAGVFDKNSVTARKG